MRKQILVVSVMLAIAASASWAQTDNLIQDAAEWTRNSLAIIRCQFEEDSFTRPAVGQAICIDESGDFLTLAFSIGARSAKVKDCRLHLPGVRKKGLQATVLGIDRETGIAFVRCTDTKAPKWKAIKFAKTWKPVLGQRVISTGFVHGDPAATPDFGVAHVSSMLRTPQSLIYVTSGSLTRIGSPVFTPDGKAVGIVGQQIPKSMEMIAARNQRGEVALQGRRETQFFTPIDELIHIIDGPRNGRQLAWTGVGRFQPVDRDVLNLDRPGVRVANVIPGQAADKAGLKDLDIIVQVDGKDLVELATPELTARNLETTLLRMPMGQTVTFTLDGGRQVKLALTAMPERPIEARRYFNRKIGLLIRDKVMLDKHLSTNPAMKAQGLLVVRIVKDSPAQKSILRANDVVRSVNAQPVQSTETFKQILEKILSDGEETAISLLVERSDQTTSVTIELPKP